MLWPPRCDENCKRKLDKDLKKKICGPGSVPIRKLLLARLRPPELLNLMPQVFVGTKEEILQISRNEGQRAAAGAFLDKVMCYNGWGLQFLDALFNTGMNDIVQRLRPDYVPHPDDLVGDSDYFESNDDDDHGRGRRRNEFASSFSSDNGHALHLQNLSTKPPPPYSREDPAHKPLKTILDPGLYACDDRKKIEELLKLNQIQRNVTETTPKITSGPLEQTWLHQKEEENILARNHVTCNSNTSPDSNILTTQDSARSLQPSLLFYSKDNRTSFGREQAEAASCFAEVHTTTTSTTTNSTSYSGFESQPMVQERSLTTTSSESSRSNSEPDSLDVKRGAGLNDLTAVLDEKRRSDFNDATSNLLNIEHNQSTDTTSLNRTIFSSKPNNSDNASNIRDCSTALFEDSITVVESSASYFKTAYFSCDELENKRSKTITESDICQSSTYTDDNDEKSAQVNSKAVKENCTLQTSRIPSMKNINNAVYEFHDEGEVLLSNQLSNATVASCNSKDAIAEDQVAVSVGQLQPSSMQVCEKVSCDSNLLEQLPNTCNDSDSDDATNITQLPNDLDLQGSSDHLDSSVHDIASSTVPADVKLSIPFDKKDIESYSKISSVNENNQNILLNDCTTTKTSEKLHESEKASISTHFNVNKHGDNSTEQEMTENNSRVNKDYSVSNSWYFALSFVGNCVKTIDKVTQYMK